MTDYKDTAFRWIAALLGAHFLAVFGYEESMFEIILEPNYWVALVFGTLVGMLGIYIVYRITVWLDRYYDWYMATLQRVALQLILGWIIPIVVIFLLATAYFAFFSVNILHSDYLRFDLPVIAILMLIVNVYYLCYYLIGHNKKLLDEVAAPVYNEDQVRNIYVVHGTTKSIPIKTDDIRQVYILAGSCFLRTVDMVDFQTAYLINDTLKSMEEKLDPMLFIRINRKMIVHIDSIEAFNPAKNQTLELTLYPPLFPGKTADMPPEYKRLHIVSEDRMGSFKDWIER